MNIYGGHFNFFGTETDQEAIQFSYFLGVIKALTAQLLNNKNKMPAVVMLSNRFFHRTLYFFFRYKLMLALANHFWNAQQAS